MIALDNAPRLVLGMASDAPASEASVAFARASKRIKEQDSTFDVSDLTSSLAQIEGHSNETLRFEYAVPADTDWLRNKADFGEGDVRASELLTAAMDCLWQWDWDAARDKAREVLKETKREDLRDEALNVLAAAEAMSGDLEKASAALKQAVEGEWNYALQQNLGIIAMATDPVLAAEQSSFWLDSALTEEDREAAIAFVLNLWAKLDTENAEIPERILNSFRGALGSELSEETFAFLGIFLANNDSEWVSKPNNWISSPHVKSLCGQMILARAEGFQEFIDFLAEHADAKHPEVKKERDRLVTSLVSTMSREEDVLGAAMMAMSLIDSGLPCDSLNNALIRALTVQEICLYFRANEGEAKVELLEYLNQAYKYSQDGKDSDIRGFLDMVLIKANTFFAINYLQARYEELNNFSESFMTIAAMATRWSSRRRLDKPQARKMASSVSQWAREVGETIVKIEALPIEDEEVVKFMVAIKTQQKLFKSMAHELIGNLR